MSRRVGFVGQRNTPVYRAWAGTLHLERTPRGRMSLCNRLLTETADPDDLLKRDRGYNRLDKLTICKRCSAKANK